MPALGTALAIPFQSMYGRAAFGSGPALPSDILQWLIEYNTPTGMVDKIDPLHVDPAPTLTGVNRLSSGGSAILTIPAIVGTESATNNGSANIAVTANTLTFGAGTIYGVQVDGVGQYNCEEGDGFPQDTSGAGNHVTAMTAIWNKSDGIESANFAAGHTPSIYVADVLQTPLTNEIPIFGGIFLDLSDGTTRAITGGKTRYSTALNEVTAPIATSIFISSTTAGNLEGAYLPNGESEGKVLFKHPSEEWYILWFDGAWNLEGDGAIQARNENGLLFPADGDWVTISGVDDFDSTATTTDPKIVPLKTKSVLQFDGVDDSVETSLDIIGAGYTSVDAFDITQTFTAEGNLDYMCLWSRGRFSGSVGCQINLTNEILLQIRPDVGDTISVTGTTTILAGTEYTVRSTWDGTSVLKVYVDGELEGESTTAFTGTFIEVDTISLGDGLKSISGPTTYFSGVMKSYTHVGGCDYDFTDYTGKTTTDIIDLYGNGNNGTLVVGSGALDYSWGVRFADSSGVVVDSANYLPIAYEGGYVNNNCEVGVIQEDVDTDIFLGVSFHGGGGANPWVSWSYGEAFNHANGLYNTWFKWVLKDGVWYMDEAVQYAVTDGFTETEYNKNAKYFGGTPGGGVTTFI